MSRREELAQYNNERLYVEGVLIDINQPNKKNKYRTGLVFGSVSLPNENIELDHVVISVPDNFVEKHEMKLFNKYGFTALVGSYSKKKIILGTPVQAKAYHLVDINQNRLREIEGGKPEDLSRHLKNRLTSLHKRGVPIDMIELNRLLRDKKEGEREQYLNTLSITLTKKDITHADILNEIYK